MSKGVRITEKDGRKVVEGLGYYEPKFANDLKELVKNSVKKHADSIAFKFKDRDKKRVITKTYREFGNDIDCLGTALISLGLKGSFIAIISENRYEWGVSYFSIVNGTGVVVPMDKYLPKNEVQNLIERGKVEAIFFSPAFSEMMRELAVANSRIRYFICMEKLPESTGDERFLNMPDLIEKGRKLLEGGDRSFVDAEIDPHRLSVLLFTSGTTSLSKGVMLSHSNIASNVTSISTVFEIRPDDVYLSILPLHHTFENTIGLMTMVHNGACVAFTDGIKHIAQNLIEYNVTLLVGVPAIFEAMYHKIQDGIQKSGKAGIVKVLIGISQMLRFVGIDIRRKLFKSIFAKFGPNLRLAVSGAAPIDLEVIKGFDRLGLNILQGYGLTEASPVVATNNDFVNVFGTIGQPIGGVEVAIDSPDEDGMGEILVRGKNVMLGYFEDEAATKEAIDEKGWLRTGDLGTIDDKGFIRITGRAKSMIVFTNGKKAFPEEYEVLLNNIPWVKDSFAWGNKAPDGDVQVCAELVIDREKIIEGKGEMLSEQEIADYLSEAIKGINEKLPKYKIIRYFVMTEQPLIKTTTLKIKRPLEQEKIMNILEKAGLDMRKASGRFLENIGG